MALRPIVGVPALVLALLAASAAPTAIASERQKRILIFSHTSGYRHESIEPGIAALRKLGARRNIAVEASEDPNLFAAPALARFDAIVFLSSTTDPKDPRSEWLTGSRRKSLEAFVARGGGIVGIHAAADSHYHWPWYGKLIGARFASHPPGTPLGSLTVADPNHRSTRGLPLKSRRADEWYYFDDYDPRVRLLISLDPSSIGQSDINPNPVSWAHRFGNARVFYTAMGHTSESFYDPYFLRHVGQGLEWVLAK